MSGARTDRLAAVILDAASFARASPDIEHERAVAIYDLIEEGRLVLPQAPGPYRLTLAIKDRRLVLAVAAEDATPIMTHALSLTPFRRILKDYFLISESYRQAIRSGAPNRIEAIDMGRRGIHNEGSELVLARLKGKIAVDIETARRLFTLISILHWRG
jgi:uncharacterized protein (UPF0262 family)